MVSIASGQHGAPIGNRVAGRSSVTTFIGWLLTFLASAALYAATASRGAQWQDSGEFILRIMTGDLLGHRGLALSHPLHHWLGRLAVAVVRLEPAFAVTLVSSIAGALAVANVFGCIRTLTDRTPAALFGATSLALANTFWHLATIAEVYTLSAALLAAECWCLALYARRGSRWAIWGMCLFSGLGLANHLQALLTLPVLLMVVLHARLRRRLKAGDALIGLWLWLLASLPYTAMVFGEAVHSTAPLDALRSAFFGESYENNVFNLRLNKRLLSVAIGFPLLNFPNLLLPAAFHGMLRVRTAGAPSPAAGLLLLGLLIHAAFALRYNVIDQHTFFLPLYVILCIFGGIGAAAVSRWEQRQRRRVASVLAVVCLLATPGLYVAVTHIARQAQVLGRFGVQHNKPYRDDYRYLFIPWSVNERSAEQMSREAFNLAGPRGLIIVEDEMARFALEYQELRLGGSRENVVSAPRLSDEAVLSEFRALVGAALAQSRPVVLVPLNRDNPRTPSPLVYWRRVGDLYVLDVSASAPAQPTTRAGA